MQPFRSPFNKVNKNLLILILIISISAGFCKPLHANESTKELSKCVVVTHCILTNWETNDVEKSFQKVGQLVEETPRTKVIEKTDNYIHAEASTRWLHYIDDLEIKSLPEKGLIQVRSESRVGIGDNGVNKKRVDRLTQSMKAFIN